MKEHSIDCILNYEQQRFDEKLLNKKLQIILSNNATIEYSIGDKSYSPLCDYMAECSYKCKPEIEEYKTKMNLCSKKLCSIVVFGEEVNRDSVIPLVLVFIGFLVFFLKCLHKCKRFLNIK